MNKWILILGILFLYNCRHDGVTNKNNDLVDTGSDLTITPERKVFFDSCNMINNGVIWIVTVNKDYKEVLVKEDSLLFYKSDYNRLIKELNKNNKVKIKLIKSIRDTVYLRILNTDYFTQKIGDTGAEWYLASVVFTLTEDGTYKYVDFKFIQGDHGGLPGKKSRKDFSSYILCE